MLRSVPLHALLDANFDEAMCQDVTPELFDPLSTATSGSGLNDVIMERDITSRQLHALLPSQGDARLIIGSGHKTAFLQFFTVPYGDLFKSRMRSSAALSALPSPTTHPILFIRTLLYLANGLQQLHPLSPEATELDLGCSLQDATSRYITAASNAMKHDEQLLQSLEGLECLILQGVYHINAGDLRPAWLCFRQCISMAQLMGLHCGDPDDIIVLDPESISSPTLMWYRIIHQDRYLSLMLGVPAGTSCSYRDSDNLLQGDCATGRLECMHSVIMGRIVARNEQRSSDDEFTITQEIDSALRKAARCLPSHWWLLPNARSTSKGKATVEEQLQDIMRTLVQLTHFNLLTLLHLPYMLNILGGRSYQYSKTACASASRELLSRYTRFRSLYQNAFCCRSIDFAAFTACLTLLLAHLESHRDDFGTMDFLAHQRLSDRAMVEETIDLMLESSCSGNDSVSQHTADILRCLLGIEAEAADGRNPSQFNNSTPESQHRSSIRLILPHLGKVEVGSDRIIAFDSSQRASRMASPMPTTCEKTTGTSGLRSLENPVITALLPLSHPNSYTPQIQAAAVAFPREERLEEHDVLDPDLTSWQKHPSDDGNRPDIAESNAWDMHNMDEELLNNLLQSNDLMPENDDETAFDINTLFSK